MRRTALAVLLLVPIVASAEVPFQEKVTVSYVEVPVTVTRNNVPVRGLTKENFEVYDGKEKRAIESFDAIDFAAADIAEQVSPLNALSHRNFLVLFDRTFSTPRGTVRAQQSAREFITRGLGERDTVAIAVADIDHGFRFLTGFTTDRHLLAAAISDPLNFRAHDPLQISGNTVSEKVSDSQGAYDPNNHESSTSDFADIMRGANQLEESYKRGRVKKQIEMFASIARTLKNLKGTKHLVLLSEGFDARLIVGRGAGDTGDQAEAENMALANGEVWKVDSDRRFGNAPMRRSLDLMAEEFRRADVVLHAVDIQGIRVQGGVQKDGPALLNSEDGLFLLANATGGTVFRNSNNLSNDFERLSHQQDVVYVLGFQAPTSKPGMFHPLKVRLVGVPSARLQHRGGYYEAGNDSSIERTLTTAEIVVNDLPEDEIGLSSLAAAFPPNGETSSVPVIMDIKGPDLLAAAKNGVATTDVFVYAFDEHGDVKDSIFQRMKLDVTKLSAQLKETGIKFYGTLSLPPGKYAIKTLVSVEETSRKGYQRVNVTVPGLNDVAVMTPLFFDDSASWVMVKAKSDEKITSPYPFVLDGESFVPAAQGTLRGGEPRLFTIFVYNANIDELTWDIAPQAKLVSQAKADGSDMTKLIFALEHVPPATRELGITIRKKGSTDERRVSVPISVQ
jgi:VWFA-related protein